MSDRLFPEKLSTYGHNSVLVAFSFLTNNTSAPATTSFVGTGDLVASLTYVSAGRLLVTMSARDNYNAVLYASARMEDNNDDARATIGPFSNEGTSNALSFNITTRVSNGTATDFSNRRVFVELVLRNSAIARGQGVP